jgi:putative endonuclease
MTKIFNKVVGNSAEDKAVNYLKKKKYKIKERNYTTKIGEIDIIAEYKDFIVFVEVKFRIDDSFGRPSEAVNSSKQYKIRRSAEQYILKYKIKKNPRFDVIEILGDDINHIENCF